MAKKTFASNGVVVEFDSNVEGVLDALKIAVERGLGAIGETAEKYAKDKVPHRTGNLKDHITHVVDENAVYVGVEAMPVPYGIYVEYGTGIYAEEGGRQTPWSYKDENGVWHHTNGAKAQPFIRPAATEHAAEYKQILIDSLQNA